MELVLVTGTGGTDGPKLAGLAWQFDTVTVEEEYN